MKNVLLVIHNRSELRRIATRFDQAGYGIETAADGLEGYDVFRERRPDAVVIDVLIPKLSGGELCLRIRRDPAGRHLPVVLLSGLFKQTDIAEKALGQWGADRYFQAPVDLEKLLAAVDALIAERPVELPEITPDSHRPEAEIEIVPGSEAEVVEEPAADLDALLAKTMNDLSEKDLVDRSPRIAIINEELREREKNAAAESPAKQDLLSDLLAELTGEPADGALTVEEPLSFEEEREELEEHPESLGEDEFPMEGSLADVSIPELIAHLYFEERTGILEVMRGHSVKHVYFDRGSAIYVESESRQESLGQILVRQGIVSAQDVMLSLENMAAYGRKQGGALVEMGLINPMQLYQALRLQMREKIINLFHWFDGEYFFDETPYDKFNLTIFELPMPRLIWDGIIETYSPESVRELFSEVINQVVIRTAPQPIDRRSSNLDDDVWLLLKLIDGKRTIAQIVEASSLDPDRTYLMLYAMLILRLYDRPREKEALGPQPPVVEPEPEYISDSEPDALSLGDLEESELVFIDEPRARRSQREPIKEPVVAAAEPAVGAVSDSVDVPLEFDFEETTATRDEAVVPPVELDSLEEELLQFEKTGESETGVAQGAVEENDGGQLVSIDAKAPPPPKEVDAELTQKIVELYLKIESSNHYELLDVPRDANELTIKMSYHTLVKKLHEDKIADRLDEEMKRKAISVVQALTKAYEILSSPKKRGEYDRRLIGDGEELKERRITTILAAERAFNLGMLAMRRRVFNEAEQHFAEACDLFPEEAEYHAYLGWARFSNLERPQGERLRLAKESVERSIKINSKGDKAYFYLGKILLAYNNKEKARQMFALAFRYNKNNEEAKSEMRRLQIERDKERLTEEAARKEKEGVSGFLKKDIDFNTVKRALKKLFL